MKIRIGFISNSSSTSFTCVVCGETEVGWDGDYGDNNDPIECVNDHRMHIRCLSFDIDEDEPKFQKVVEDMLLEQKGHKIIHDPNKKYIYENTWDELDDILPESGCPICSFEMIYEPEFLERLLWNIGKSQKEYLERFKQKYATYKEFLGL